MTLALPRFQQAAALVDDNGYPSAAFHIWWDNFASNLETNFNDLSGVVQGLVDLNDPNLLTPAKKPIWIMLYSSLTGEQANIDAQATSFGITTEKTNYDNALSTLTSYLASLTTPVAWNDLTGNTTIVGTTFNTDFTNVFTKKQILLDKMHDSSKVLANTAQTSANTAQTTANTGVTNAATAQTTANTGVTNAAAAQTTANTGVTNAATAQSTADTVKRDDSISSSWTAPGTILSATDAGSDATITVAAHTRGYSDTSNVSVSTGSLTGLAYSTLYYVYYDQTSKAGGSVTFHAVTNANTAMAGRAAGRHFCGSITTPAAAGAPTSGGVNPPSGGGGIHEADVSNTY